MCGELIRALSRQSLAGGCVVDLALWLSPLDGENPSGEDLRNHPRFHELERLAEPQIKVDYDDHNKPSSQTSIPVDWATVLETAEELRSRGRDLRLLTILARALAGENGLAGVAEGLTLIGQNLETHWDSIHPGLRPGGSPADSALRRVNALRDLQNRNGGLLGDLQGRTFFSVAAIGPVTGRDLEQCALDERTVLQEAASGLNASEKAELAATHARLIGRVRGACAALADNNPDELTAFREDGRAALSALDAVDMALNRRLGSSGASLPELRKFLERIVITLERTDPKSAKPNGVAKADEKPAEASEALDRRAPASAQEQGNGGSTTMLPDRIGSREEVVKCLDLVVDFYDRTEPSSPIPHLARRVRKMVHMDFVELMEDLAPSGLKEFRLLAGLTDSKKTAQ
jgi:type VI secretion system protein ImpA